MSEQQKKQIFALIGLGALCWFFCIYRLGATSISPTSDEIIHIRVVQEMLQSGGLLHPTYGGEPYFNKPPLKMWLSLIPLSLFGESNFSYRVLDGLSGIGVLCLVFVFARRYFESGLAGVLAALALCGARVFVLGAHGIRHATQDSFMLFLSTVALVTGLELVRGYRGEKESRLGDHAVFCVATGLAVFTKSVGGLMPPVVLAGYLLTDREARIGALRCWRWWVGCGLLGIAPAAAYYGYHLWLNAPALLMSFKLEIVDRAMKGYHNRSRTFYYWRALFLREEIGTPVLLGISLLAVTAKARFDYRARYLAVWSLLPLCLYSLSKSKLPWYILVAYPALALSIGILPQLLAEYVSLRRVHLFLVIAIAALLGFRAYRVGTHILAVDRLPIDVAVETVLARSDSSTAIVGNPLRLSTKPKKFRRRIEFIYLSMLRPQTVAAITPDSSAKNFFCNAADCAAVVAVKGEPVARTAIPPLRPRKREMFLLQY